MSTEPSGGTNEPGAGGSAPAGPDFAALLKGLGLPRQLVYGGGAVYLLSTFLPWLRVEVFGLSESANGWHRWGLLGILGMIAAVVLTSMGARILPEAQRKHQPIATLGSSGVCVLGTVICLIDYMGMSSGEWSSVASAGPSFGLYLGLVASAATAAGAFLGFKEAGGKLPGAS